MSTSIVTISWERDIVAQDGNQWLDLNGFSRGGVFQFINTVAGDAYGLRFWYSDNPFSNGQGSQQGVPKTGNWSIRNDNNDLLLPLGSFTHSTATGNGADWFDSGLIVFVATSATTRIAFSGDVLMGSTGPFIDNVSVQAVPEPATTSLLGAGLIAMVLSRRRRSGQTRRSLS